jgi:hypothetical protein
VREGGSHREDKACLDAERLPGDIQQVLWTQERARAAMCGAQVFRCYPLGHRCDSSEGECPEERDIRMKVELNEPTHTY